MGVLYMVPPTYIIMWQSQFMRLSSAPFQKNLTSKRDWQSQSSFELTSAEIVWHIETYLWYSFSLFSYFSLTFTFRGSHQFLAAEDFSIFSAPSSPSPHPILSLATGIHLHQSQIPLNLNCQWFQTISHHGIFFRMLVGPNSLREVRHKPF